MAARPRKAARTCGRTPPAGFAVFRFGRCADDATCACDAAKDGVTNPPPVNGNTRPSLSADDDGGYFKAQVRAYYAGGVITLPR